MSDLGRGSCGPNERGLIGDRMQDESGGAALCWSVASGRWQTKDCRPFNWTGVAMSNWPNPFKSNRLQHFCRADRTPDSVPVLLGNFRLPCRQGKCFPR